MFSARDLLEDEEVPAGEAGLLLNIALHEDSVRHCPAAPAARGGQLKLKLGRRVLAKREAGAASGCYFPFSSVVVPVGTFIRPILVVSAR